jgi:energy-coupling factor transporter ATP-binding protein EcfA2
MSSVDAIIETESLSSWLDLQTASSKQCLSEQLHCWTHDVNRLLYLSEKFKRFKIAFEKDPSFFGECHAIFKEIAEIEKQLHPLIYNDSKLEKESYNEILFFHPILQPLNFVPVLLSLWATIRIYILPGMSLIFPILTLLSPYFVLKFLFHLPMTFSNYMNILQSILSGNIQGMFQSQPSMSAPSSSPVLFLKQFGLIVMTLIQGIVQPYWSYKHLNSIDTIINDNGELVLRFETLYHSLEEKLTKRGFTFRKCPLPEILSKRNATARIILESSYFKLALKYIGSLEVMMRLAQKPDIHPVKWVVKKGSTPVFNIKDTFDFHVPEASRKTVSATFSTKQHALLTGPNKGGKSTVLRALSISALLGHTYGCSFGHLTSTPFHTLFVCLKPDDLPGTKSRFEREVEFTSSTLSHTKPILIMIDELYHSTNPPDALRSCHIYCEQLWKKPNVVSIISTHLFELVEQAPANIQRICCPASIDKDGNVIFSYELDRGICKVSSVDTLLKQYSFVLPHTAV